VVLLEEIVFKLNEILIGLFLVIVLVFYIFSRKRLSNFPHRKYFELSLASYICSKIFTIVEDIVWEEFFNILEHLCLLIFSIFLTLWIIKMTFQQTEVEEK
jgi:hypothetical protein